MVYALTARRAIDGCIQLRNEHNFTAAAIASVRLRVASLVLDLCNKKKITLGLEGKFSVYHAAAIGLVRGRGSIAEFTDETVNHPDVRRVRELVEAVGDPAATSMPIPPYSASG